MLVEPGFFRTELLTPDSTTYAKPTIDDYAARTRETIATWYARGRTTTENRRRSLSRCGLTGNKLQSFSRAQLGIARRDVVRIPRQHTQHGIGNGLLPRTRSVYGRMSIFLGGNDE